MSFYSPVASIFSSVPLERREWASSWVGAWLPARASLQQALSIWTWDDTSWS